MTTIAVLYPGEMGSAVSCTLGAAGVHVVSCVEHRSPRTKTAAESAGVTLMPTLEAAVKAADLVLSLVPQDAALGVATAVAAVADSTGSRSLFVDANSVSPARMADIDAVLARAGCMCVDGAFVGNASSIGTRTTLYLSGPHAGRAATLLRPALSVEDLGAGIGVASAFKASVYGFSKGLVALFLEMMCAADRVGLRDRLLEHLREFYPGSVATALRLLPSYPRHAARRALELDEVVDWLAEVGQRTDMASATRRVLSEMAALGVPGETTWEADALLDELCRRGLLRSDSPPSRL